MNYRPKKYKCWKWEGLQENKTVCIHPHGTQYLTFMDILHSYGVSSYIHGISSCIYDIYHLWHIFLVSLVKFYSDPKFTYWSELKIITCYLILNKITRNIFAQERDKPNTLAGYDPWGGNGKIKLGKLTLIRAKFGGSKLNKASNKAQKRNKNCRVNFRNFGHCEMS